MLRILNKDVSEHEIKDAYFDMRTYKVAGPDGLPPIFFKKAWGIIGDSVIKFVKQVFVDHKLPDNMNEVLITLIPKVDHPEVPAQFRPIALANVIVKMVTKVLGNRMRLVIGELIHSSQSAFIPGRSSADNIIIAQEAVHYLHNKKGKKGYMIVKVDLEKAYDRVDWRFLENIMRTIGIENGMVSLIMNTITSVRLSVLWNGQKMEAFSPNRGIRQGDPLAPYLFVLCMEVLSEMINQAVDDGSWKPLRISKEGPPISHIFFADDLLLFGEATVAQAQVMESILKRFCICSGQKVSLAKSSYCTSRNVSATSKENITNALFMKYSSSLGSYLGVPLIQGRLRTMHFTSLLDKMKLKLSSWSSKTLSKAGRHIMIQSSIASQAYYHMQTFKLPISCIAALEKVCRDFLWGDEENNRKMHYVSWNNICKPKHEGGLGIRRLNEMNIAFLGKLIWQLVQQKDKLWVQVLSHKYLHLSAKPKIGCSPIWRGICKAYSILWKDLQCNGDDFVWSSNPRGVYTVASGYYSLIPDLSHEPEQEEEATRWRQIWKLKGPARANFFLWSLKHNAIPTYDFLARRHIIPSSICPLCGVENETLLHALRDCVWATQVWTLLLPRDQWRQFFACNSIDEWIHKNLQNQRDVGDCKSHWKYLWRETVYGIWLWRNKELHNEDVKKPPAYVFISQAVERAKNLRLAWQIM